MLAVVARADPLVARAAVRRRARGAIEGAARGRPALRRSRRSMRAAPGSRAPRSVRACAGAALRAAGQRATVLAFVHRAFWRSEADDGSAEQYIGPVLRRSNTRLPEACPYVSVGPSANFRARRWWHPVVASGPRQRAAGRVVRVGRQPAVSSGCGASGTRCGARSGQRRPARARRYTAATAGPSSATNWPAWRSCNGPGRHAPWTRPARHWTLGRRPR